MKRKLESQSASPSTSSTITSINISQQVKTASQLTSSTSNVSQQTSASTYSFSFKDALKFYPTLNFLEKNILFDIHMIMPFESAAIYNNINNINNINKFMIIRKNGEVYSYRPDEGIKLIENLCGIKTFIPDHRGNLFALTNEGMVYFWNCNNYLTQLFSKLILVLDLHNKNIVDIVCTKFRTLALTVDGKVYTWEWGIDDIKIVAREWKQLKFGMENTNIVCIASDSLYSMKVTDIGTIYSSLSDDSKNDNTERIFIFPSRIVKVACGFLYALALTDQGDLYVWGKNDHGQLGVGNVTDIHSPVLLKTSNMGKLLDIAAVSTKHISVAINEYRCVYVWGLYGKYKSLIPVATFHENMHDVFAYEKIMYKPLILSANGHKCANKESNTMRCLKDAFDNSSTSDFKIHVEGRDIHVHKTILKICSSYFRTTHNWKENTNVLKLGKFSYNIYKAYLKYCYTGVIDIDSRELVDLSKLADVYGETDLKTDCIFLIQRMITISNAARFYNLAIKVGDKRLEESCFSFALKNMTEIVKTDSFRNLDENTKNMFLIKAAETGAFKK